MKLTIRIISGTHRIFTGTGIKVTHYRVQVLTKKTFNNARLVPVAQHS